MRTAAVSTPKQGKGLRVGEAVRKHLWNKAGQSGLSSNDTPGPRKSSPSLGFFLWQVRWWQRQTEGSLPTRTHRYTSMETPNPQPWKLRVTLQTAAPPREQGYPEDAGHRAGRLSADPHSPSSLIFPPSRRIRGTSSHPRKACLWVWKA